MEFDYALFEAELQKQLTLWQSLLSLRDWNIDIRIVRQWEMSDPTTLAECSWYIHRKDAVIRVLHPHDLAGLSHHFLNGEEADYDTSLVHELLHLHFAPLDNGEDTEIPIEQAINAISRGMTQVYREKVQASITE